MVFLTFKLYLSSTTIEEALQGARGVSHLQIVSIFNKYVLIALTLYGVSHLQIVSIFN